MIKQLIKTQTYKNKHSMSSFIGVLIKIHSFVFDYC